MLKSQDIVILLKILSTKTLVDDGTDRLLSQNQLATLLCMSVSEVNAGIKRLAVSGLIGPAHDKITKYKMVHRPIKLACEECLIHGVKYFFPAKLGELTPGIATGYAAPLFEKLIMPGNDPIPVWPYALGDQRGLALEPLYRSVPQSIKQYPDTLFYELLVLIDAIRAGRARERAIAIKLLREKLNAEPKKITR